MPTTNLPQGTLDLLILKALALTELHGHGISHRIEQITDDVWREDFDQKLFAAIRLSRLRGPALDLHQKALGLGVFDPVHELVALVDHRAD